MVNAYNSGLCWRNSPHFTSSLLAFPSGDKFPLYYVFLPTILNISSLTTTHSRGWADFPIFCKYNLLPTLQMFVPINLIEDKWTFARVMVLFRKYHEPKHWWPNSQYWNYLNVAQYDIRYHLCVRVWCWIGDIHKPMRPWFPTDWE